MEEIYGKLISSFIVSIHAERLTEAEVTNWPSHDLDSSNLVILVSKENF
jgi:hypothetical protein